MSLLIQIVGFHGDALSNDVAIDGIQGSAADSFFNFYIDIRIWGQGINDQISDIFQFLSAWMMALTGISSPLIDYGQYLLSLGLSHQSNFNNNALTAGFRSDRIHVFIVDVVAFDQTLFSNSGPINSILVQIGFLKEPYQFMAHVWSVRGLVAFMNCLMWFGNTTILLMAGMMGIDPSLFEAAQVDGATATQIFYKITLPLLKPILIYVMITSLIGGLQMFDVPQILTNGTGDPMRSSMTLIMYLNKHLFSKNFGLGGALSVFMFIITGILSLIVFKFTASEDKD